MFDLQAIQFDANSTEFLTTLTLDVFKTKRHAETIVVDASKRYNNRLSELIVDGIEPEDDLILDDLRHTLQLAFEDLELEKISWDEVTFKLAQNNLDVQEILQRHV